MDAEDYETLLSFECGIECGNRIKGSDYIWCIRSHDGGLIIKNTKGKYEVSSPYHNFGIASNVTALKSSDHHIKLCLLN